MLLSNDGKLRSLIAPITPFYSTPTDWLQLEQGKLTTYSEIYRKQPAVRSVVDFLAGHCARMPIKLFHRKSEEDREHLYDHPGQKLLSWPGTYVGRGNFWRDVWLDKLIYDRFVLIKIREDGDPEGDPIALVRVPPVWFTPYGRNYFHPDFIRVIGNRGWSDFPVADCVYVHGYDPVDPRIGVSPMETLRTMLEEEAAGALWRQRFWQNGAQPSMVITRPVEAPDWSDTTRDRFVESLSAAAKRGKPLLLEEGMTSNPASAFDPKTAEYVDSKKFTREEVLRVFNLPLGLFDPSAANFSSINQYRSMLYAETLPPIMLPVVDELELQLLTEWFPEPYEDGVSYEAMIEEKMRGNIFEQIELLSKATGAPFVLRSEARSISGFPYVEGMDEPIVPFNVLVGNVGGAPNEPATGLDNQGDPGTKTRPKHTVTVPANARSEFIERHKRLLEKFVERQKATVLSRVGAGLPDALDRSRWDQELEDELYKIALATATFFGTDTAEMLGAKYNEARTFKYWREVARVASQQINSATAKQLMNASLDEAKAVFEKLENQRIPQLAVTRATHAMSWGMEEGAKQSGMTVKKVWNVTSGNPRPSHAELDGEAVPVGEPFPNGMLYPGDPTGGPDETAGCTCITSLEV